MKKLLPLFIFVMLFVPLFSLASYYTLPQSTTTATEIYGQGRGLYITGGYSYATSSSLHDNSVYGIQNTSGNLMTAICNYWGASNGPSGEGAGDGDAVSTNVDYDPWLDGWPGGACN